MTEIRDGLVLPVSRLLNDTLTYQGKELKFECIDETNQVYKAATNLSEEEKKHNKDMEFIYSLSEATGTIVAYLAHPNEDPELKDLTDSERVTKINSIAYQTKQPEPTDLGNTFDQTLDKAVFDSSHNKPKQIQAQNEEKSTKPNKSKSGDEEIGDFKISGSGNIKKD